jgi:hypothetical protein
MPTIPLHHTTRFHDKSGVLPFIESRLTFQLPAAIGDDVVKLDT